MMIYTIAWKKCYMCSQKIVGGHSYLFVLAKLFLSQDVHEIKSGIDWQDSLNYAVSNCEVFVPLITSRYGETQWTNREVRTFLFCVRLIIWGRKGWWLILTKGSSSLWEIMEIIIFLLVYSTMNTVRVTGETCRCSRKSHHSNKFPRPLAPEVSGYSVFYNTIHSLENARIN